MSADRTALARESTHLTTLEVARMLGMAVRSVQLMVDRGELDAWRTPGGHRRIARASVTQWLATRSAAGMNAAEGGSARELGGASPAEARQTVLLIEDSVHHQNLIRLLVERHFPSVDLHICADGISGLATFGRLSPDVLIVDILLPGVDGAALITTLRSRPEFDGTRLLVVTALDTVQRERYALTLEGLPVVHKPVLVAELPGLLEQCLRSARGPRQPVVRAGARLQASGR